MQQENQETIILVVDDSASVQKLVELTLRRRGYSVISASSGVSAFASLAETPPDLILLDVMLVALDGFQISRTLRRNPDFADIPIIILSGRETDSDRQAGLDAGVDAYLTKPFKPDQLIAAVEDVLARKPVVRA